VWHGRDVSIWLALRAEYNKAAQQAIDAGDFRRAAFIYGKLLSDWRLAADALARGDLHRDAAILFRDKLGDQMRAAHEFAEAGEFDTALAIYQEKKAHGYAGDLLRRIGNENAAVEQYLLAANALNEQNPLSAGEYIFTKTNRSDLAEIYFARGWALRHDWRGGANAVPCAARLAKMYAEGDRAEPFFQLLTEGEAYFSTAGNSHATGLFFNTFAELTDPPRGERRDEVRDRCLLALANKLRDHAATETKAGELVPALFGATGVWEPAVVRDAAFALKVAQTPPRSAELAERAVTWVRLAEAAVTATAFAWETGELFAACADGSLVYFSPRTERVERIEGEVGEVRALAVEKKGSLIVTANFLWGTPVCLNAVHRHDGQSFQHSGRFRCTYDEMRMSPTVVTDRGDYLIVLRQPDPDGELIALRGAELSSTRYGDANGGWDESDFELLLPGVWGDAYGELFAFLRGVRLCVSRLGERVASRRECAIGWTPHACTLLGALPTPPLSWLHTPGVRVEIAGLGPDNAFALAQIALGPRRPKCEKLSSAACPDGYRCGAMIRSGTVAALTGRNRVVWLRAHGHQLLEWAPPVDLGRTSPAVACHTSLATGELLVLLANGALARVPVPA
jgi:hypothetical protein